MATKMKRARQRRVRKDEGVGLTTRKAPKSRKSKRRGGSRQSPRSSRSMPKPENNKGDSRAREASSNTVAALEPLSSSITASQLAAQYPIRTESDLLLPGPFLMAILCANKATKKVIFIGPDEIGLQEAGAILGRKIGQRDYVINPSISESEQRQQIEAIAREPGYVIVCPDDAAIPSHVRASSKVVAFDHTDRTQWKEVIPALERLAERVLNDARVPFARDEPGKLIKPALVSRDRVFEILAAHITHYRLQGTEIHQTEEKRPPAPSEVRVSVSTNETAILLDDIRARLNRHLILPPGAASVVALFSLHCWAFSASRTTPIPAFTSPVEECGKTTTIELLLDLLPQAVIAANPTPAAIFQRTAQGRTIILDEGDVKLESSRDLLEVLNVGVRKKGAVVIRANDKEYSVWSPKVLAKIGPVNPASLRSRCILIEMDRKLESELCEPVLTDAERALAELAERAAKWADSAIPHLTDVQPELPRGFHSRRADKYSPLFAIADYAGKEWSVEARCAAVELESRQVDEPSTNAMMIADIADVWARTGLDQISSEHLARELRSMEDRPWVDWGPNLRIRMVRTLVSAFKIKTKNVRVPMQLKGYSRDQFADAFKRYVKRLK